MKQTIIYHSADFDGIFCREIGRHFLPNAELIGWNFGDEKIPFPEGEVYVMDLSPECLADLAPGYPNRLTWIDHHKTSIEKWDKNLRGRRIDGVAACRIAWQWFTLDTHALWPSKEDFIARTVNEPWAVRLAGEYDIWDKRDPDAETFQYSLRSCEPQWDKLLSNDKTLVENMIIGGRLCQRYAQNVDASVCKSLTYLMEWEGLRFLCVNHARFNSLLFTAKDVPETGHDALLGYRFDGKQWMVSLYHAKHRTDLDLSKIASKHGGGGHRGACGFTCKTLPF